LTKALSSVEYEYDKLGRETTTTNPDDTTVRRFYGFDDDWQTTVVDENSHQRVYVADAFGRLNGVQLYAGAYPDASLYATWDYEYDVADQLTTVVPPDLVTTTIEYDMLGRKTQMQDPDMGTWDYAYDAAGNLTTQDDAEHQRTCFYYDELNRLEGKYYTSDTTDCPTSPTYAVSYGHDEGTYGKGRRTSMSVPDVDDTTWTYDARGRVTEESKSIAGAGGGIFVTQWGYDAMDRVTVMKYPGGNGGEVGEPVTLSYNDQGLLDTVEGAYTYVGGTEYDALGRVTERRLGSGGVVRQSYTYSAAENYRLTALSSGTGPNYDNLQDITYGYDDAGNVLSITDAAAQGGSQTQSFTYDELNRLETAEASPAQSYGSYSQRSYSYNAAGNITNFEGTPFFYEDGAHAHGVTHLGGQGAEYQQYWYDENGNVSVRKEGDSTYYHTYDVENRLSVVSGSATGSYWYDGDRVRVKSTVRGVTTSHVGDIYEKRTNGVTKKYYYANGQLVAMRKIRPGQEDTLYFLLTDHLGSTNVTTDSAGAWVGELRYYAFGGVRHDSETQVLPYRFTGQRLETAMGLYDYGARYYDPVIGRFIQADTIVPDPADPQSLNRYSYVLNNPLRYTDTSGYWFCESAQECEVDMDVEWAWRTERRLEEAYGIEIEGDWTRQEVQLLSHALGMLAHRMRAGGAERLQSYLSGAQYVRWPSDQQFVYEGGRDYYKGIHPLRLIGQILLGGTPPAANSIFPIGKLFPATSAVFYDETFQHGTLFAKRTVVHETGHNIDWASGGRFSRELENAVGTELAPVNYGEWNRFEGFAVTVEYWAYPDPMMPVRPRHLQFIEALLVAK
jgi:RHS repeat-associated protein